MKRAFKEVSATEVKNRFGDYLGQVIHGGQVVLVERHGRPVAVLVSYDNWTGKQEAESSTDLWLSAHKDITGKIAQDKTRPPKHPADALIRKIREEET